jgi:hypothetical protein
MVFSNDDLISIYTRAEAIEDGELVDVSSTAVEVGIKFPVAVTRAVWVGVVEPDEFAQKHGESIRGRLWDVICMLKQAIVAQGGSSTSNYRLIATKGGRKHTVELKSVCGPGDTPEPVITIMLPNED